MELIQAVIATSADPNSSANVWDLSSGSRLAQYRAGGIAAKHAMSLAEGRLFTCEKGKPLIHVWHLNKQHVEKYRLLAPGKISCFDVSKDSSHTAVAVAEKIHLYQNSSGMLIGIGTRHFQPIHVVKFSHDGTLIACGGDDGLITVWNMAALSNGTSDPEPQVTFHNHTLPVTDLRFSYGSLNSRIVSVSLDRTFKVMCLSRKQLLYSVVFDVRLTSVCLLRSEAVAYVGSANGGIHEINLHSPPRVVELSSLDETSGENVFAGHENIVSCLTSTDDSNYLISGSHDETIKIWHIDSRQCVRKLQLKGAVTNVICTTLPKACFSHDFTPKSILRNFTQQSTDCDEDEGPELQIFSSARLSNAVSSTPIRSSNSDQLIHLKHQMNDLRKINQSLYLFALKQVLNKEEIVAEKKKPVGKKKTTEPSIAGKTTKQRQFFSKQTLQRKKFKISKNRKKNKKKVPEVIEIE